ncbi:hypothetical protein [Neochlamydia sp. S13]|uniref:hypothetical protein n=1 Tax=Neochlamydia sp. S13 TaxID=1353976 RepID=UPI0005AB5BF1|nr:hypothetical protein [Neochlamydia sp. S13]BBI17609.1 hypothetical protein NCS13_1_1414 [Neochlamydia sp. S13]
MIQTTHRNPNASALFAVGADEVETMVTAFSESLKSIKTTHGEVLGAAIRAEKAQQQFIEALRAQMLNKMAAGNIAEARELTILSKEAAEVSLTAGFDAVTRMADIALRTLELGINHQTHVIQEAIKTRLVLIQQEGEKIEIIISAEKSKQELELQKRKFDADIQQTNEKNKAEILQRQYDAYLAAYNKDMEVAKAILAKHRNVEIKHQPPSMDLRSNTVTQGWVKCVGRG